LPNWESVRNIRSLQPDETEKVEVIISRDASDPLETNHRSLGRLSARFDEISTWSRINFKSPAGSKTLWLVEPGTKTEAAMRIIFRYISETESIMTSRSWVIKHVTKDNRTSPVRYMVRLRNAVTIRDLEEATRGDLTAETRYLLIASPEEQPQSPVGPILEFPKEFVRKLECWDSVREGEALKLWDTFENPTFPAEGFWPVITAETIISNPIEAEENYNKVGKGDDSWFEEILEKGVKTISRALSQLEETPNPESIAKRVATIAEIDSRFDKFIDPEEGWFMLQKQEATKWANSPPENNDTWLIDALGNWNKQSDIRTTASPLHRIWTMLAYSILYEQTNRHLVSVQNKTCPDVGMQWNINWTRIGDKRFIRNWTKETLADLERPDETTYIEIIGRGNRHRLVWIPSETAPRIELWNFGETSSIIRFKANMQRIADHHAVADEDKTIFREIGDQEWTRANVDESLEKLSRNNFVSKTLLVIGKKRLSSAQFELLETIEKITEETKKQAVRSEASLKHVLLNLTGGWKWTKGKIWVPTRTLKKVKAEWMKNRTKLAKNPKPEAKEKRSISIASNEWVFRFKILQKEEGNGNRMHEDSLNIQDFETERDAWVATNIWLNHKGDQLETKLNQVEESQYSIIRRDRTAQGNTLGLVWYSAKHNNRVAEVAYALNDGNRTGVSNKVEARLRTEKPTTWASAMEIVETETEKAKETLVILAPREDDARELMTALGNKKTQYVTFVTQSRDVALYGSTGKGNHETRNFFAK
jgi:hypothetical protein